MVDELMALVEEATEAIGLDDFCMLANVSKVTVWKLKKGSRVSIETLERLALYFGRTIEIELNGTSEQSRLATENRLLRVTLDALIESTASIHPTAMPQQLRSAVTAACETLGEVVDNGT